VKILILILEVRNILNSENAVTAALFLIGPRIDPPCCLRALQTSLQGVTGFLDFFHRLVF
jgi:hypothetical protein